MSMVQRSFLVSLLLTLTVPTLALAGPRDVNHLVNPDFEDNADGKAKGWSHYGEGYELVREGREGGWCIRCRSDTGRQTLGAAQEFVFDPPVQHPLLISGWSKAAGVERGEYSVYLDVHYADGTPLWGQQALFERGTHDWARAESIFTPAKPVARIQAFVLFRRAKGTAWFDDIRVSLAPQRFTRTTALGGFAGAGRIEALASVSLPSTWQTQVRHGERVVFTQQGVGLTQRISWNGRDAEGQPVLPGTCTIRFAATDLLFGETATWTREVDTRGAQSGRNFALWTESSMRRVMPVDMPETADPPAALVLSAARNESESGQIVIMPPAGAALHNVRVAVSDLAGPEGARIAADNVQWHQVGYVWVEHQHEHPDVPRYGPCWWPDPLLPVQCFDVDPGWAQPVWITVHVPEGTPPGAYTGQVIVSADGHLDATVPLRLRVHDFTVPTRGRLKTAFALMQGFLEKVYGAENVTPKLRQAYGEYLLAHRLNPDDITRTDLPALDDLAHYRDRGLNAFNVLNMVEPRGAAPWRCWSPPEIYTPQFKQGLIGKLDPFVAGLKARGLADWAYVYSFDERPQEFNPILRDYFGLIKQRYGLPTLTTAKVPQDPAVMRDLNVDWNCPVSDVYSFEDAERCRAAGLQVWAYVCCGPREPFANFLADDPLIEARLVMWQAFHQKLDGFLYWGVNVWSKKNNDGPLDLSKGARLPWSINTGGPDWPALHGDGVLLYPLPQGPAGCIRLANLRDGLEDYEYLWALGRKRGDPWSARKDCEPVTTSLTAFTRDPLVLLTTRERVARELSGGAEGPSGMTNSPKAAEKKAAKGAGEGAVP
jgi:hypothetical protein